MNAGRDAQSILGKTPVGIARHAQVRGIRCIAVVGRCDLAPHELQIMGIDDITSASEVAPTGSDGLSDAPRWVAVAAEQAMREMLTETLTKQR